MRREHATDVLLVSLGSTEGLRRADDELHDALCRAGARVAVARPHPQEPLPTMMLTDLAWARAARAATARIVEQQRDAPARAIVYSTTTAALLWSRPGAIRFDATAAGNRRGRHGLWQRPLERRRLSEAPLLLPWSRGALAEAGLEEDERTLVLPVPVDPSGPVAQTRDVAAVTYAANPAKKGLDRVLAAWRRARAEATIEGELHVAGASAQQLREAGIEVRGEEGVRVRGSLPPGEFRALLRRARAFVCAPRREDYGIAQLEALADGCLLVTTPAPGPYAALPIACELDPRLVGEDLAAGIALALSRAPAEAAEYAQRAQAALAPFGRAATDRLVAERLLPRLLA